MTTSGVLVYERRPEREKLRDVLVVGVMPEAVRNRESSSFVKACWVDCMARLGRRLAEAKLRQSEFRWIECDAIGRPRHASFLLDRLHHEALAQIEHERFRREFFAGLRWLPDYVDLHPGIDAEPIATASAEEWCTKAWRAQTDHAAWNDARPPQSSPAARFSFVHVMVFLPATSGAVDVKSAGQLLGRLRAQLALGYHPRRNVSVTYSAVDPATKVWGFGSSHMAYEAIRNISMHQMEKLTAELQRRWLTQLTREIWHG
jgi:hypothetical protein